MSTRSPSRRPAGDPPTAARLREAAILHLARYEATEAAVRRVLERRVARWARAALGEGADETSVAEAAAAAILSARGVVAALAAAGGIDDRRFAANRVRRHAREGKSARASQAHLAAAGIDAGLAREAAGRDAERELDAAVAHARRRRLGPFAPEGNDADEGGGDAASRARRALGSFARAGFGAEAARAALGLGREEAEARLRRLRRGEP